MRLRLHVKHRTASELLARNALSSEVINNEYLFSIKQMLEEAEAKKLQPHFVRTFFIEAFNKLNGSIYERENGRFEITHVPSLLKERDRRLSGRNRRDTTPVLSKYERVCFEKELTPPPNHGKAPAVLLHPGHPLLLAITDTLLEKHATLLRKGTVLIDKNDAGDAPSVLFILVHEIRCGRENRTLSKRLQFVRCWADGRVENAGDAPHLDLEVAPEDTLKNCENKFANFNFQPAKLEPAVLARAATELTPRHFEEVKKRHEDRIEKTLTAVHERLTKEISFWTDRHERLSADKAVGKDVRLPLAEIAKRVNELQERLDLRTRELQNEKHVTQTPPIVLGGAIVLPTNFLNAEQNGSVPSEPDTPQWAQNAEARKRIEVAAMQAVMLHERKHGCHVEDVSAKKCGWDITAIPPPNAAGKQPIARHIEVKGRATGAKTITITRNEILYALNQREKFHLALVFVNEDGTSASPLYKQAPFTREPDLAYTSAQYDINKLFK